MWSRLGGEQWSTMERVYRRIHGQRYVGRWWNVRVSAHGIACVVGTPEEYDLFFLLSSGFN